jgi:hypothetical protein
MLFYFGNFSGAAKAVKNIRKIFIVQLQFFLLKYVETLLHAFRFSAFYFTKRLAFNNKIYRRTDKTYWHIFLFFKKLKAMILSK